MAGVPPAKTIVNFSVTVTIVCIGPGLCVVKNLSSSPHESCGRDLGTISWNFLVQNPHEETSNDRFHEPPAVLLWRLYQEFRSDLCRGLPVILQLALLIATGRFTQFFWETPRKHPETLGNTQKHWKHTETRNFSLRTGCACSLSF